MPKCPFLDEDFDLDIDEPCPVCGVTGRLSEWMDGEKCVGDIADVGDELHQVLSDALKQTSG
jgi:hypothetical protein